MTSDTHHSARARCYTCFKPASMCICRCIQPVNNRTRVVVIQHGAERNHPIGTARIAALGLKNVELLVVYADDAGKMTAPPIVEPRVGLLYPSPNAMPFGEQRTVTGTASEKNGAKGVSQSESDASLCTLIVLDGTWPNAKKLYNDNRWLQDIPHYKLTPDAPSNYRIRKEPTETAISTIEAIAHALSLLEPDTDVAPLLNAFDAMIDDQIRQTKRRCIPRERKPRQREPRTIPPEVHGNLANMVIIYGESLRTDNNETVPVSLCALRIGTGAIFEQFIALERRDVTRAHLRHGGIDQLHATGAVSVAACVAAWNQFIEPADILVAWNAASTFGLLVRLGCSIPGDSIALRAVYANTQKRKFGSLDDVVSRHQLPTDALPFSGRAATRMANVKAVLALLRTLCASKITG